MLLIVDIPEGVDLSQSARATRSDLSDDYPSFSYDKNALTLIQYDPKCWDVFGHHRSESEWV